MNVLKTLAGTAQSVQQLESQYKELQSTTPKTTPLTYDSETNRLQTVSWGAWLKYTIFGVPCSNPLIARIDRDIGHLNGTAVELSKRHSIIKVHSSLSLDQTITGEDLEECLRKSKIRLTDQLAPSVKDLMAEPLSSKGLYFHTAATDKAQVIHNQIRNLAENQAAYEIMVDIAIKHARVEHADDVAFELELLKAEQKSLKEQEALQAKQQALKEQETSKVQEESSRKTSFLDYFEFPFPFLV